MYRFMVKIFYLLSVDERSKLTLLLAMVFISALLDAIGVASIMPFMTVLTNPDLIQKNTVLSIGYRYFGMPNSQLFLFFLGVLVFILLILSQGFKALTTFYQLRFSFQVECSLSRRLLEGYLYQPYAWFLNQNSSDLSRAILSEVNQVINFAVMPAINLIAYSSIVVALVAILVAVDPVLSLSAGLTLAVAYGIIFKFFSQRIKNIGEESVRFNKGRFAEINEVFGAIKEVKFNGLETVYLKRFNRFAENYAERQASAQTILQIPRSLLETIVFGGMLLTTLYLMNSRGGIINAMPIIALYAIAGYRLMPALQHVYASISAIHFALPLLDKLNKELIQARSIVVLNPECTQSEITLAESIKLDNISFGYPNAAFPTLKNLSISIPVGAKVGFIGKTGGGKTTLVDLILGLLDPSAGSLIVDNQVIDKKNSRQWQRLIGYVPQHIHLVDDSVAANIAIGVGYEDIDLLAVEQAARLANLHQFISEQLPDGYATKVGERGVRLSGGQRQRIGIARALYRRPKILVLDEATSALDGLTEKDVMDGIDQIGGELTIIMIAHRFSTLKNCDQIFVIDNGIVRQQGTYSDLALNAK